MTQNFYNAHCTQISFFVDKYFESLDPKIHGSCSYLQSFFVAALIEDCGTKKHYPLTMFLIGISSWSIVYTLISSCKCICNGAKTTVLLHPSKNWSFHVCIIFRNWLCHSSSYILELKQWQSFVCAVISKRIF